MSCAADSLHAALTLRACRFWLMAFDRGESPVHWIVHVDPRGDKTLRQALRARTLLARDGCWAAGTGAST